MILLPPAYPTEQLAMIRCEYIHVGFTAASLRPRIIASCSVG